jgi:hypothetical protein
MAQPYSETHTAGDRNLDQLKPSQTHGRSSSARRVWVRLLSALFSLGLVACAGDVTEETLESTPESTPAAAVSPPPAPVAFDRDTLWETYDRDNAERLTAISRLLAGLAPESNTIAIDSAAWTTYAAEIAAAWGQLESTQLAPLQAWRDQNLAQVPSDSPVLYPFSGPDFLYASSFFPNAPVYVMIGLEPIGALPDFENASEEELSSVFEWVNKSLYALLNFSFFRTNAMEKDLKDRGTLPLLMLFAARNGYEVLDLAYVGIDDQGNVKRLEAGNPDELIPGIRVDLLGRDGEPPQQLYYFSMDLSDAGFDSRPGLEAFFGQLDRPITYLKAASYLMHNEYFSIVRDALLERSQFILQDDSGIPLRFFDANNWTRSFFGEYTKPIDLFSTRLQADLKAEYTANPSIEVLPFGVGYQYEGNSNLMLAERQGDPPLRGELESPEDLMPPSSSSSRDQPTDDSAENTSGKAAPRRRDRNDDTNDNPDDARDRPNSGSAGDTGEDSSEDRRDRNEDPVEDDPTRVPMPDILRERLNTDSADDREDTTADDTSPSEAGTEDDQRIQEP